MRACSLCWVLGVKAALGCASRLGCPHAEQGASSPSASSCFPSLGSPSASGCHRDAPTGNEILHSARQRGASGGGQAGVQGPLPIPALPMEPPGVGGGPSRGAGTVFWSPGQKERGLRAQVAVPAPAATPCFLGTWAVGHMRTRPKEQWLAWGAFLGLLVGPGEPRGSGTWEHMALGEFWGQGLWGYRSSLPCLSLLAVGQVKGDMFSGVPGVALRVWCPGHWAEGSSLHSGSGCGLRRAGGALVPCSQH